MGWTVPPPPPPPEQRWRRRCRRCRRWSAQLPVPPTLALLCLLATYGREPMQTVPPGAQTGPGGGSRLGPARSRPLQSRGSAKQLWGLEGKEGLRGRWAGEGSDRAGSAAAAAAGGSGRCGGVGGGVPGRTGIEPWPVGNSASGSGTPLRVEFDSRK
jgi:hypothetical protein